MKPSMSEAQKHFFFLTITLGRIAMFLCTHCFFLCHECLDRAGCQDREWSLVSFFCLVC